MNQALLSPYKVLFVDDEAMAVKYFKQTLEDSLTVLTAGSVDEAITILDAEHAQIGVLVTDQRMPGKQGVALLHYAREHYPQITRILATAFSDLSDAIAAVNSGEIFRYIKKPWDPDQLIVDIKIAMDIFALQLERDELITAKMSVYQQLVMLGRVKDLVLISGALQAQMPQALTAIRHFLSDAHQALNATEHGFVVAVDQLDLGQNLVVETHRSSALMAALMSAPMSAPTPPAMSPEQAQWNQAWPTHRDALRWPEQPAYTQMQAALWLCYQQPPTCAVQAESLEIKGVPAQNPGRLWGVLTENIGAELIQATQWLRFYLWAAECGLAVRVQKHTESELCLSLCRASAEATADIDGQWLDDLFDQFAQ
ncbi:MAG: response regulator [Pseudomonadota bacterium]